MNERMRMIEMVMVMVLSWWHNHYENYSLIIIFQPWS